jgi:hypothetical protein
MSEQIFPSWWGPKGGDPIHCRNAQEICEGWIAHRGRYDVQIGRWVPDAPHRAKPGRLPGLSRKRRFVLVAIAAAEGVGHATRARRKDLIAAIRAKRAGG